MLEKINHQLERFMPLITPVSVLLGMLLTHELKNFLFLVPWIFAFMTFSGSLGSNFTHLRNTLSRPVPIFIGLAILHVFMPLWAWAVGHIAFPTDPYTITGLVLAMVIPCGITSSMWVSIYKGNSTLALSIILIDTLLSPLVVPIQSFSLCRRVCSHQGMANGQGPADHDCHSFHCGYDSKSQDEGKHQIDVRKTDSPYIENLYGSCSRD